MAAADIGQRTGEARGAVTIAETGVGDALAPRISEAVVSLRVREGGDRQSSRGDREGGAVCRSFDEEVVALVSREAGGRQRIAADIAGLGRRRREGERARGRIGQGVRIDEAADHAGEGRIDQAILAGGGVRRDRQRGRGDREDTVDGVREDVIRGNEGAGSRGERVIAHVARRRGDTRDAGGASDAGGGGVLTVHEAEQIRTEARVGRTIDPVRVNGLDRERGLADGQGTINEAERIVTRGESARGEHIRARVGRALARSGKGERTGQVGGGIGVAEAGKGHAVPACVGERVVSLAVGDGRDRQRGRGHREGCDITGGLGKDVVAVISREAVAGDVVAADIAGDRSWRREGQGARRGGGKTLAVHEAGDRTREGRVGQTVLAGGGIGRERQRGRGDRQATVGDTGDFVVGRRITRAARDDRIGPDIAGGDRDGSRTTGAGDTGASQSLAVDEAREGRGEGRVSRAVGTRGIRGDHRERGLVHREGRRHVGDRVVRAGET